MKNNILLFWIVLLVAPVTGVLYGNNTETKRNYAEVERYMCKYYVPRWWQDNATDSHHVFVDDLRNNELFREFKQAVRSGDAEALKVHQSVLVELKDALWWVIQPARIATLTVTGGLTLGSLVGVIAADNPESQGAFMISAICFGLIGAGEYYLGEKLVRMNRKNEKFQLIDMIERRMDLWSQLIPDTVTVKNEVVITPEVIAPAVVS